jgi:DNA-binding NarL/FixJ family response regulator
VVAEARDALEALRIARELNPDLVLIDSAARLSGVPEISSLGTARSLPLIVSMIDVPQELSSGAELKILKGIPMDRMRRLIVDALDAHEEIRLADVVETGVNPRA